jgi:ribose/xylose/arabinose/galactoside ABC-type transport system permease subunit
VPVAMVAMVTIATMVGLGNGLAASWLGASPFIVTLGMLLALQGISLTYAPSSVGSVPAEIVNLYDASIGPLPLAGAILLVAFVMTWFALRRTTWGRSVYAAGGNATASRLAGISVTRTQMSTYVLTAILCVVAALIILSRSGVGDPQTGDGLELSSITAVVLGGTSLFGGRGALLGTLGGVLLLAVISTVLDLLQVPSSYQSLVSGLVIVVAIAAPRRAR